MSTVSNFGNMPEMFSEDAVFAPVVVVVGETPPGRFSPQPEVRDKGNLTVGELVSN